MGTTLQALRRQVGNNISGRYNVPATLASANEVNVPLDLLRSQVGTWVYYKNQLSRANNTSGSGQLTIAPDLTDIVVDDEVELWNSNWNPLTINALINQAISQVRSRYYDVLPPIYGCIVDQNRELTLADNVTMVQDVFLRRSFYYQQIYGVAGWDDSDDDVTVETDNNDFRGSQSVRIEIDSGASIINLTATPDQSDYSGYSHMEGWFKSVADIDLEFRFRNDDASVGDSVALSLEAGEWTYLILSLPNPYLLNAIDEVELRVPAGGGTLWTNGLWATLDSSIEWLEMRRDLWRIDQPERKIVFMPARLNGTGPFNVVRIHAGTDPVELEDDDDETNVDTEYLVSKATELVYSADSGGSQTDFADYRQQATLWAGRSRIAGYNLPPLVDVIEVRR